MNLEVDDNLQMFAVIVGEGVTKGARSPLLWNRAFDGFGINAKMFPVDVNRNENIDKILDDLFRDRRFMGGAVAAPLKLEVSRYASSDNADKNNPITPVNCFFRDPNGGVEVADTDILAAIESIETIKPLVDFRSIAILGSGAIAHGLCKELKAISKADISVFRRSSKADELFEKLGSTIIKLSALSSTVSEFDLIVNCTSVGKDGSLEETPISEDVLLRVAKSCIIFDVNYINAPSKLLRVAEVLGIKAIDGRRMNLVQASIGFHLATGAQHDVTNILKLMEGN